MSTSKKGGPPGAGRPPLGPDARNRTAATCLTADEYQGLVRLRRRWEMVRRAQADAQDDYEEQRGRYLNTVRRARRAASRFRAHLSAKELAKEKAVFLEHQRYLPVSKLGNLERMTISEVIRCAVLELLDGYDPEWRLAVGCGQWSDEI